MIRGSVDSIESFGLVDGPGIRTVVFMSGCKLRCKYCHNPEMWSIKDLNYTPEELTNKIIRNKPYFKRNNGGVTFSGGEPLLQSEFIIEVCKMLKQESVHIALDTAGVGFGNYDEILSLVDLVILDVKAVDEEEYKQLTGRDMKYFYQFVEACQKAEKPLWLRQVIVPGLNDDENHAKKLRDFAKTLSNVQKIELLPYKTIGAMKYTKLGIRYALEGIPEMDEEICKNLEKVVREK